MIEEKQVFVERFKQRTKVFAIRIIKMYQVIAKSDEARILGKQLIRSATFCCS